MLDIPNAKTPGVLKMSNEQIAYQTKPSFDASPLALHYFVFVANDVFCELLIGVIEGSKGLQNEKLTPLAKFLQDMDVEFEEECGFDAIHLSEDKTLLVFWESGAKLMRRAIEDRNMSQGRLEPALHQFLQQLERYLYAITTFKENRQKYGQD